MSDAMTLLIIEDNPGDARFIQVLLDECGLSCTTEWRERLSEGIACIMETSPDAILLDLGLPDSRGIETFLRVKDRAQGVPVIILTGMDDERMALQSVQNGAQDYLVKGQIDGNLLRRTIQYAIGRKLAEEALRQSEEQYRTLVETLDDIIFQADLNGKLTFLNSRGFDAFETAPEEVIGQDFSPHVHPDDVSRTSEATRKLLKTGRPIKNLECRFVAKRGRGRVFPAILNVSVIRDATGAIIGIQGVARDITEFKEAERQIRSQNRHLSIINQIITLANSSILLAEMLEIILTITVDLLDYDVGWIYLKQPDGERAELVVHHGVPLSFAEQKKQIRIRSYPYNVIFFGGQPRFIENLPSNPPGLFDTRILEEVDAIAYAAVPLVADSMVVGALFVGRQKRYTFPEQERTLLTSIGREVGGTVLRGVLQERLEDAYDETTCYLNIMNQDVRGATQDLNETLKVVRQMLEGPAGKFVDKMTASIQQIEEILTNVSIIRRIGSVPAEPVPVDLDEVLIGQIARFSNLPVHYRETGIMVQADEFLPEIFSNLIGNSRKYGGEGVEVWIHAEETGEENVLISVEDSGPGIVPELRHNLFSSFRSSSQRPSGRGLGLLITRLLVNRYGGEIYAEDRVAGKPSAGTAIRFTLLPAREHEDRERLDEPLPGMVEDEEDSR
ncbi:MAG: PAS domain S-box protein [Methanomicrobiaceae archaeon]|nr:PAS domain S-box protein [Methanomicrobiaceae archaeon]